MKIYFNGYFFNYEKEKLIEASLIFSESFKISNNYYFNIHSVNEEKSKLLNNKYFGKKKAADVLSFPLKNFTKKNMYFGDIAISFEICNKRSKT